LCTFVAAGQQNDQLTSLILEIHPITGAVIDPQLRDAFSDWFDISRIARRKSFDPDQDPRSCTDVSKAVEPLDENICFANLNHGEIVAKRLRFVNIELVLGASKGIENFGKQSICIFTHRKTESFEPALKIAQYGKSPRSKDKGFA
jgi:hypothetical protein